MYRPVAVPPVVETKTSIGPSVSPLFLITSWPESPSGTVYVVGSNPTDTSKHMTTCCQAEVHVTQIRKVVNLPSSSIIVTMAISPFSLIETVKASTPSKARLSSTTRSVKSMQAFDPGGFTVIVVPVV